MIISKKKDINDTLDALSGYKRIFLIGCNLCASLCQTGGEKEVAAMIDLLKIEGKGVTGYKIVDAACHLQETKKALREQREAVRASDAVLSLACGAGTQTLASIVKIPIFTAVDTLFLGTVERWGHFVEVCNKCGDCVLNFTAGICPVTRCPKQILNGPCGGVNGGKCETDPDRDCVWVEIYKRLREQGRLEQIKRIFPPRDYSKNPHPNILILCREDVSEQAKGGFSK